MSISLTNNKANSDAIVLHTLSPGTSSTNRLRGDYFSNEENMEHSSLDGANAFGSQEEEEEVMNIPVSGELWCLDSGQS